MAEGEPTWTLISVLFSSFSLDEGLARALHGVAVTLHTTGQVRGELDHQLAHGVVRSLQRDVVLGSIGGPLYEAELTTERGEGVVRFLLTRAGLELLGGRPHAG